MKFNEFKNPQLTEEQIVLSYCKGEITKEDAVSHLSEMKISLDEESWRDKINRLSWGLSDSDAEKAAQKKAQDDFVNTKGLTGHRLRSAKRRAGQAAKKAAPGASFSSNLKAITGLDIGANKAQAASPKPGASVDNFAAMPKTPPKPGASVDNFAAMPKPAAKKVSVDNFAAMPKPAAKTQVPSASAARAKAPVKATAANTRDYDKTMALQKKLIAQGANIKADGLMGPNTRAAMKAANMGAGGQKMRTDMPGGPRISNAKKPLMKPKATTAATKIAKKPAAKKPVAKKPRTLGKQNSKMPKSFGGIGPRVDDPKGGETVNLPFGMSYKTLPQKDDGVA